MAPKQAVKLKQIIDPMLAKALAHPLRNHILLTLGERGVASPKEIAAELGLPVTDISYHVRKLIGKRLVRLVRTVQRRGVHEHFYELTQPPIHIDDDEWTRLPAQVRSSFAASLFQLALRDATDALNAGTYNAEDCHQSRLTMPVDARGRREAMEVMSAALERLMEIKDECAARLQLPSDEAIPLSVFMTAFESAAGAARRRQAGGEGPGA